MESRRDYRKLMNIKKRNKTYAKMTILGALGLGIGLANSTTTQAAEREWKANTSTTIKQGDTEYKIVWGDTLSLISKDSGITMDTLATLNNILNQDLIFEGNIIQFGNGATATVKDTNGNVIAETPLTQADQQGIKEAQNKATNNASSNVNNSSSSKTNGTTTNTNSSKGNNNSGVINTVKPVKPTENGNGGTTTKPKPVNPIKPVDPTKPIKPVDPVKPVQKEFTITVNHVAEDGTVLSKESRKAKEGTTVEAKAIDFSDRGYELVGKSTQTVNVKENATITFTYKKVDTTKPEVKEVNVIIKHVGDDGKVLSTETRKAEKGSTVKADAKDFTEQSYVLNDEISKSVKATEGAEIKFNYRKIQTSTNEDVFKTINVDTKGKDLGQNVDTIKYVEVSRKVDKSVEKLTNGNTITTHTTTITWELKDVYVPKHTEETKTKVLDESGNYLGDKIPAGYKEINRKTEDSKTTATNGDTHTIHLTTIIVKKDEKPVLPSDIGNSGMMFDTRMEAHNWAMDNQPDASTSYGVRQMENGKYTVDWLNDVKPTNEDRFVSINKDTNGKDLGEYVDTTKYSVVNSKVDDGVVETLPNGNTITTYTTTDIWELKDIHVPETIHTYEQNVVDQNGVFLGGVIPNGYTEVSRSTVDKQIPQSNGDTIINHSTTIIVKKDATPVVPSDIGNSGMQFNTEAEAFKWGSRNHPDGVTGGYGVRQMENGKYTVDFM